MALSSLLRRCLIWLLASSVIVTGWGQHGGTLGSICANSYVDVVVLAFLTTFFGPDGLPVINFASSCNGPTFSGTDLLQCTQIGQDIKTCQNAGIPVLLSLGGAVGTYGFANASQATTFATTLWNLFGEGTSATRPFGTSVVDGFDLDIENQMPQYYSDFVTALRGYFATGSKQYYISGAPQCPFPDASLGPALDASVFDMVWVQFYNNPPCGVESSGFNYATWQNWATSQSPNPNVKVYVGVPGSSKAAHSGYITPTALDAIIASVQHQPNFGGVMMWDATLAIGNVQNGVNYAQNAKSALLGLISTSSSVMSSSTTPTTSSTSKKHKGPRDQILTSSTPTNIDYGFKDLH